MNRFAAIAKTAAEIGANRAITTIAPASDARPYHENFEFHRRRLAELAEMLSHFGVRLGVEFVAAQSEPEPRAFQFINSLDQLVTLVNMISQTNLGIVLDLTRSTSPQTRSMTSRNSPPNESSPFISPMPPPIRRAKSSPPTSGSSRARTASSIPRKHSHSSPSWITMARCHPPPTASKPKP